MTRFFRAHPTRRRPARLPSAAILALALSTATTAPGISAQGPARPDRSRPPALGPAPALDLPSIQKRTLSNGLPVLLIERDEVPLAQVNLVVHAGSGDDPQGKYGVASLAAAMLDEGAGSRSALQIADDIDFLGASLGIGSSFDASSVRLNVPVARLADALPIMADVVLRPTFSDAELDRLRQERLTALLQARDDPASIAAMTFSRIVFGPEHRYGAGAAGSPATLKAFTRGDLAAFHTTYYHPSNAALIVVGAVRANDVMPLLEKNFGAWKGSGTVKRVPVPSAQQVEKAQIYLVDKPGAAQSQIRLGWVGAPRSTPEYFTLQVLNTILGGSFTSRLNQNLREKHGYAYGAGSAFDMRLAAGPFVASAGVQTDKTADALREFQNELLAIGKPVGAEELAKAKNYVALGFPGEFETGGDLSRRLEELLIYKLPENYFENYVANIQKVTAGDVQKAAATYIQPSRFVIVVVGDRKVVEPAIRALNLAPVRVMSVEEAIGQ